MRRVSIYVFFLPLALASIQVELRHLLIVPFVVPGTKKALLLFAIILKRQCCIHRALRRLGDRILLSFNYCIRFMTKKVEIGAINRLGASSLFDYPSAAAYVLNNFAICVSSVSPITSLRSRLSMTCSTTLKTIDHMPLCAVRIDVLKILSNTSSTKVALSATTHFLTADRASRAITSFVFVRRFLI